MRLSKEKTKELLEAVRGELIKNPSVTIFDIQNSLNVRYGHIFDKNFLGKLKNKIHKERFQRYNKIVVQYELAKFEDTIEGLCTLLWNIVDDGKSTLREKINAMREIRSAKSALLETMFNSGIFENNFNKSKNEGELSPEEKEGISRALNFAFNCDKPTKREDVKEKYENVV